MKAQQKDIRLLNTLSAGSTLIDEKGRKFLVTRISGVDDLKPGFTLLLQTAPNDVPIGELTYIKPEALVEVLGTIDHDGNEVYYRARLLPYNPRPTIEIKEVVAGVVRFTLTNPKTNGIIFSTKMPTEVAKWVKDSLDKNPMVPYKE